jgi:hypothetical protein
MTMGWWKTAKPGDKIVCINDEWRNLDGIRVLGEDMPVRGGIYTIAHIRPDRYQPCRVSVSIAVFGIYLWNPEKFRPVQIKSTETGMAILRKLLTGKRARQRA